MRRFCSTEILVAQMNCNLMATALFKNYLNDKCYLFTIAHRLQTRGGEIDFTSIFQWPGSQTIFKCIFEMPWKVSSWSKKLGPGPQPPSYCLPNWGKQISEIFTYHMSLPILLNRWSSHSIWLFVSLYVFLYFYLSLSVCLSVCLF